MLSMRLLASLLPLLVACTHVHRIEDLSTIPTDVTLITASGRTVDGRVATSPTGLIGYAQNGTVVPDIVAIETVDHGFGLVEGAGLGLLGAAGLATLGLISGDDPECEAGTWFCWRFTRAEKAALFGVGLGVPTFVIATIAGGIRGSRDRYVISRASDVRIGLIPEPQGASLWAIWSF